MSGKHKSLRERMGLNRNLKKTLGLDQSPKRILDYRPSQLPIGYDQQSGERAALNLDLLRTHLHVIGRTGTGKTRFLALLAQQLLQRKIGGCLIDIQGGLYHLMENYIAYHPELAERVIFLNAGEAQDPVVSFNPFHKPDYLPADHSLVDMAIEAIMKHNQETDQVVPTFKNTSTQIFRALIESRQTILEAEYLVDDVDTEPRDRLLKAVTQQRTIRFFKSLDKKRPFDRDSYLLSFRNRLNNFLWYDMLRYTLGRTEHLLDFQNLVDNDKFLMVNLRYPIHLSFDAATLIGIFLIHQIFYYCVSRHEAAAQQHPFVMMIDEMQNFITPDLVRILDQCRQKGLHLVLAHQRLQQLKSQDTDLYSAVMDNARTKVIFAVPYSDAELLAPEITKLNLKQVKHELYRTAVLDYELEYHTTKSRSASSGTSGSHGSSATQQSGRTSARHETGDTWPSSYSFGEMEQVSAANMTMESYGHTETTSEAESEVPMLMPILGQELSSVTFYSPEELKYMAAWQLKAQPQACAVIKRLEDEPQLVKIQNVPDWPFDENKVRAALEKSRVANPDYYLPMSETKKSIEARQQSLQSQGEKEDEEEGEPVFKTTGKIKL